MASEHFPERFREDEKIIRLTIEQIQKDFDSFLPPLIFSGEPALIFDELVIQLSAALKNIHHDNRLALQPLLYKIDIREAFPEKDEFKPLARKIIEREFKKVLTRKFFSK